MVYSTEIKKSEQKFLDKLSSYEGYEFKLESKYVNVNRDVKITHVNGCGETFSIKPRYFTDKLVREKTNPSKIGSICPVCDKRLKSEYLISEFEKKLKAKHGDDWSHYSGYTGSLEHVKIVHKCGYVKEYLAAYLINGSKKKIKCKMCETKLDV